MGLISRIDTAITGSLGIDAKKDLRFAGNSAGYRNGFLILI